jgi:hypothetical protein
MHIGPGKWREREDRYNFRVFPCPACGDLLLTRKIHGHNCRYNLTDIIGQVMYPAMSERMMSMVNGEASKI